jgi:hypothetical protein
VLEAKFSKGVFAEASTPSKDAFRKNGKTIFSARSLLAKPERPFCERRRVWRNRKGRWLSPMASGETGKTIL